MPTVPPADPLFATSLAHGLQVLEAFAGGPAGLTNQQLAQRTGLSKASISRLTDTLATRGLVVFDPVNRDHRLGSTTLTLAYPLLASLGLRRLARMPMKKLSEELGGTVSLGMRERTRMVYVETSRSADLVSFRPDVGAVLPMLQSAVGRAWLAGAGPGERADVLQLIRSATPAHFRQWVGSVEAARADLTQRGHCMSRGDWRPDVHAVAVPLDLVLAGERLVLNCGMPTRRLAPGDLEARVGPRLVRLARQIEADWRSESTVAATPFPVAVAAVRPNDNPSDRQFARTLARGIDLLLSFQPGDEALGNGTLARRLGLLPSTVVRLTHTLTRLGYLRRDSATHRYTRYRLGAAALASAYPLLSNLRLRDIARPAMLALAERVGGSVSLGVRHQTGMVYVENAWRTDGRLIPPDTGTLMPMMASAMGRAWLCRAEASERKAVLNQIRVLDAASHARHAAAVSRALSAFEHQGYCWSRDVRPEVEAVGVPLSRAVDGVRYVMNCGVLAPTALPPRRAREVGAALVELVREVESALMGDKSGADGAS